VDGVLTDGGIWFTTRRRAEGFHIRDGLGIALAAGRLQFGLPPPARRTSSAAAGELHRHRPPGVEDKLPATRKSSATPPGPEQVCYIGDDLTDLPVIRHVGLGVAVADAAEEVRNSAALVTSLPGGRGAVRELVETILKAKGRWEDAIHRYMT
jgi:3-deoxy-D-manno-octulosonate 8-phosphate phosphatase KdsC-like HAD superfamily phosphatase